VSDFTRREALTVLAATPLAAALPRSFRPPLPPAVERAARAAEDAIRAGSYDPAFFTPHEWRTVRALAEMIIPRDGEAGGALDAGVPEFIDFTVDDRPPLRGPVREGLSWLDVECRRRFQRPAPRRRLHRQRLQHAVPHPGWVGVRDATCAASGARTPQRGERRGAGPRARRGRAKAVRHHRRHGGGPGHRRDLADRAEPRARRERRGDRPAIESGRGTLKGWRARSRWRATWPRRRASSSWSSGSACHGLPREPALRAAGRARPRAALGPRRRATGRPYLARAAEEHSGPHMPWFWQGRCRAAAC
jgi:hypothetical protein